MKKLHLLLIILITLTSCGANATSPEKMSKSEFLGMLSAKFKETNASLPMQVDEYTKVMGVLIVGDVITYKYEVTNEIADICDNTDVKKAFKEQQLDNLRKSDPANQIRAMLQKFRVKIQYSFFDESGRFITAITINSDEL